MRVIERAALRNDSAAVDAGQEACRQCMDYPFYSLCQRPLSCGEAGLALFRERTDAQLVKTRRRLEGQSGAERLTPEACERLKAMGYVQQGCS